MKGIFLAGVLALGSVVAPPVAAQQTASVPQFRLVPIDRPAEPDAIPLWPAANTPAGTVPESWGRLIAEVGGQHMDARIARNVAVPTMTPVLPDRAHATGAAVIVAPGGAFLSLSMDSEGYDVAHWLADHGIAAFVLKYRLDPTPADDGAFMAFVGKRMAAATHVDKVPDITDPHAAEDALRAIELVREGAARWQVDPKRVGIIGFSAGAMTALQSVLTSRTGAGPSFVGFIYGPMAAVKVPADAPPLFAALALDDPLFGDKGFGIVSAWQQAGHPVELHAYERGNHGFGMGRPGTTTTLVMPEFRLWLETNGFLGSREQEK
jgi:acetyl esterase/lipase